MATHEVRQRIRDGMRAASGEAAELLLLKTAWLAARPDARKRFLVELTTAEMDGGAAKTLEIERQGPVSLVHAQKVRIKYKKPTRSTR